MGLESATFIHQLNSSNPVGGVDPVAQGDDHIRMIKATLQATFPNINGAMTVTLANLNQWAGLAANYNWSGQHRGIDGNAGAPAFSFTGDIDTGFYRAAGDRIGVATAGVSRLLIDNSFIETSVRLGSVDGVVGSPGFYFSSDPDTGCYRVGANNMRVSAGGIDIWGFANAAGTAINQPFGVIQGIIDGSVGTPLYSFNNDPDCGMYRAAANDIRFAAGGVDGIIVQSAAVFAQLPLNIVNGAAGAGNNSVRFGNDTDTGFYRVSADYMAFEAGGSFVYAIRNISGNVKIQAADGTAAEPIYVFNNEPNTGLYRIGAGQLGFSELGTGFRIGFRQVPRSTTATTLAIGDVGKCVAVSAAINIPASVFSVGDCVSIYNDSAASVNITTSAGTLRLAGTTTTGTRSLAARGMATLWFNVGGATPEVICSGAGVG